MAPEQATGRIEDIDERSDIYSLGAILYQALSGHVPHDATQALQAIESATTAQTPCPFARNHSPGIGATSREAASPTTVDSWPALAGVACCTCGIFLSGNRGGSFLSRTTNGSDQ